MSEETLAYYFADGTYVIFDKYTIDTFGNVVNKKSGEKVSNYKSGVYQNCGVYDDNGKQHMIRINRAIASTFLDHPLTQEHTSDHIDRNPNNNTLDNIRWLDRTGQVNNQDRLESCKSAFIIIRNDIEKTCGEWVEYLKDEKNQFGRDYTNNMIKRYAQTNKFGFSYKKYQDLPEEVWLRVNNSETSQGRWEISNMNRMKYITKNAENVIEGSRLGIDGRGYPSVSIHKKNLACHIISFSTFFPEEYANKKPNEIILHEDDDKLDFRPHKLRLGTKSENGIDAHDNGKYDGKKTARKKCCSYVNDIFEKEHASQEDAVKYLISVGIHKANRSGIWKSLKSYQEGEIITRYGRTWKM